MATLREILLAKVGEEAGEVAQMVGKCQSYSLTDAVPVGYKHAGKRNVDLLRQEIIDLIGNWEVFADKCKEDGVTGVSLFVDEPMPGEYEIGQRPLDRLEALTVQAVKDRRVKVIASLRLCVNQGTLSSRDVPFLNIPEQGPTLKPGDIIMYRYATFLAGTPAAVTALCIYDPLTTVSITNQMWLSGIRSQMFSVLREEPQDRMPYLYLTPLQAGLDYEWFKANLKHLVTPDVVVSNFWLAVCERMRTNMPAAYESWFEKLGRSDAEI